MTFRKRVQAAARASAIHFACSLLIAAMAAGLVFGLWYPFPYRELSGGRELFLLVVVVDIVCGPLLTAILYNPKKPRAELLRDLGLVALIQIGALCYGLWTVQQARPLFMVFEVDRFKVINAPALEGAELKALNPSLFPAFWEGPKIVAIRKPRDAHEKNQVLFSALSGGRDYAERPDFYIPYADDAALQAYSRSKKIESFLEKYPQHSLDAEKIALEIGDSKDNLSYIPIVGRQDWVAILHRKSGIVGYMKGDGF
jgi:hypothetical protein